jgi:TRAP-type mannitol/chloroaromatic compound transport system substrate-binding protein
VVQGAFEQAWRNVVNQEAAAAPEFRRVWRSLKTYRSEHAIWSELSRR